MSGRMSTHLKMPCEGPTKAGLQASSYLSAVTGIVPRGILRRVSILPGIGLNVFLAI